MITADNASCSSLSSGAFDCTFSCDIFPTKVEVAALLTGRYPQFSQGGKRPMNWTERTAGFDHVLLCNGLKIVLKSNGQQSPPAKGWVLMLLSGNQRDGYLWTLYGMSKLDG